MRDIGGIFYQVKDHHTGQFLKAFIPIDPLQKVLSVPIMVRTQNLIG